MAGRQLSTLRRALAANHGRGRVRQLSAKGGRAQPWDYFTPLHALLRALPELVPPTEFADRTARIDESLTSIDNTLYSHDELADGWHNADNTALASLQLLNPARVPFFVDALARHARLPPAAAGSAKPLAAGSAKRPLRYLDIGCGGGILTEELARAGAGGAHSMHGLDLSSRAVDYARGRATALGLTNATYEVGSAYDLSRYASRSFDGVVMSDVLEHLHDLPRAMGEVARVLRPGGVFAFDTINRTVLSYVLTIVLAQDVLKVVPARTHDWRLYIRPEELSGLLQRHGFESDTAHYVGMKPSLDLRRLPLGQLPLGDFYQAPDTLRVNYLGWARRRAAPHDDDDAKSR
jgi:2-polyprenyl-6-hydroxyphenyl methylase/3-demethylubiquinone-9 3-methyltransferase